MLANRTGLDEFTTYAGLAQRRKMKTPYFEILDEITSWRSVLQFWVLVSSKRCLCDFTYLTVFAANFSQI